ncbi:DUF5344 family protein [Priestia megaterium]|uniref:DUF5344 family protein n=1 Tax=Priestia megaterium TaxID=1404 RepID=UPI0018A11BC7|nr:DUF5344 family protein [Priestia megaterium]MCM3793779.1 YwqI/YxiC family protein [Priestia megaterium]
MADEIKVIDGEINRTLSDLNAAAQQFQPLFPFHVGSGQELAVLDELNQLNQQLQTLIVDYKQTLLDDLNATKKSVQSIKEADEKAANAAK